MESESPRCGLRGLLLEARVPLIRLITGPAGPHGRPVMVRKARQGRWGVRVVFSTAVALYAEDMGTGTCKWQLWEREATMSYVIHSLKAKAGPGRTF